MRKFLERHGWLRIEARKIGCFKQVLWLDKKTQLVYPQYMAVQMQRDRIKYAAAAVDSPAQSDTAPAGAVPAVAFPAMLPAPGFGVGWN
jgi:hypothetical protein